MIVASIGADILAQPPMAVFRVTVTFLGEISSAAHLAFLGRTWYYPSGGLY